MNEFETTLMKLQEEAAELQLEQGELAMKGDLFTKKLVGFLKENGLPENFTMPELALLAIRKARA